jgi:hypothetical protein
MISEKALQEAVRERIVSAAQAKTLQAIEAGLPNGKRAQLPPDLGAPA